MKICRLCLHEGEKIISLSDNKEIIENIKQCVSVDIAEDDHLPKTVCTSCLEKVKNWSNFKETCLKSNKYFLEQFSFISEDSREEDLKYLLVEEKNEQFAKNVYTCDICSENFKTCTDYLDHQPSHNGSAVFKCDKCPQVYTSREDLVAHDQNHKRPCPKCGKMILKSSMKLHLIKHTDRHMCPQCSGRFNSRAALLQHVITLHTDQKDHICEACGKRFSSKTAMTVHLRSHSEERLYKCKLCTYAGRTASAVYVHMSTHAKDVCVCEVCSKIFKSTRNLKDHLRRVHSKEKRHKCTYCDKKFVDKYMLQVHVRCHTGVRPYSCHLCDKAFIRSDGLKEHLAIHGERNWFQCEKCQRKFASKKGVTRHNCHVETNKY